MNQESRPIDILLIGVTGHTGQLVSKAWAKKYGLNSPYNLALAGRSEAKLEKCAADLAKEIETNTAQSNNKNKTIIPTYLIKNESDLKNAVEKSKVVINVTGPYQTCGEPIVKVCSETGTDYIDATGEVTWVKEMSQKYEETAKRTKAQIVPFCGIFGFLYDLGVASIQNESILAHKKPIQKVEQVVAFSSLRPSGGTLRTVFVEFKKINFHNIKNVLFNPFYLCAHPGVQTNFNKIVFGLRYSKFHKGWLCPSFFNHGASQFMHWANQQKNFDYGNDFVYHAADFSPSLIRGVLKCLTFYAGMFGMMVSSRLPFLYKMIPQDPISKTIVRQEKYPSVEMKTVGIYKNKINHSSTKYEHTLKFVGGDGYTLTAYTLLETALSCLKQRLSGEVKSGGFKCPSQIVDLNTFSYDQEFQISTAVELKTKIE